MQVDCLNAVVANLESANEELQEEMNEMADAEVTFIQLEMVSFFKFLIFYFYLILTFFSPGWYHCFCSSYFTCSFYLFLLLFL